MTDLIAWALNAPFRSFEEANQLLVETAQRSDVKHLSYWFLNLDGDDRDDIVWLSTYDPAYMSSYMHDYTPMGDPDIGALLGKAEIIDWTDSIKSNPVARRMYKAAGKFGISKFGVSFAFKDAEMGTVIFSVNSNSNTRDWSKQKEILVERFEHFAHDFHDRMRPLLRLGQKDQSYLSLCA
jgi:Autoinducer binding domain